MSIENIINNAWKIKDQINRNSDKSIIDAIKETIHLLNEGKLTVAEPHGNDWKINEWIQKGILLSFRVNDKKIIGGSSNNFFIIYSKREEYTLLYPLIYFPIITMRFCNCKFTFIK